MPSKGKWKRDPEADADLVCQPGILWMDVNAALAEKGARILKSGGKYFVNNEYLRHPAFLPGAPLYSFLIQFKSLT